ncbi:MULTISPECIES: DUF1120 domain-containing protein [Lelliottia]|uniref:DUF1120 domain-containing protein n=1 Tax=Lelliottia aquatilis TaxID=2080838 RepID=A0ABX5A629_9ENTR|nr:MULTISPECIES: DUF1120 domain-containing protein [Lelliottia]NTZ45833.1 DUF1120 domain-containing protein [Lelliottia aquatilis]POZ24068.1 hypothetical protein C3712_07590 [Lelliottia aquatilis]POZ27530.1 hypothetical protein C3708_08065 [Lelliottia sp. 7254-16]POZ29801.1 hypothetical protein C3711_01275 [Lelliottia aquatilis]POZ35366.1 hypothetical protein C3710_01275 [Lelliottia aquatilis]
MKTIFKFCAAAALVISTANSAFAAETAVMKVTGKLVMGSCTPTLASGGVVDYGSMSVDSLSDTAVNQLGQQSIQLSVACTSPTKVAWTITDDRSSSVVDTGPIDQTGNPGAPASEFGLGVTADDVKLGSYSVVTEAHDIVVDGAAGILADSTDNGATWAADPASSVYSRPDGTRLFTYSDAQGNPIAFKDAADVLVISAAIQNTTTLAITDDTVLDGQATISIKYL